MDKRPTRTPLERLRSGQVINVKLQGCYEADISAQGISVGGCECGDSLTPATVRELHDAIGAYLVVQGERK
ncbi:hypothetical protein JNUCC0626_20125 [Lentzea sp. JNUCC 0626]|uniref:hypothetical protein n=1 Tax=Lentzea sp. JNUCC 0626 TaxID=3367513 RepID=UPI0037478B08